MDQQNLEALNEMYKKTDQVNYNNFVSRSFYLITEDHKKMQQAAADDNSLAAQRHKLEGCQTWFCGNGTWR